MKDVFISYSAADIEKIKIMGLHVGHMLEPAEIEQSYKFITDNAARTLNISSSYGIKKGNSANLIILDAKSFSEALCNNKEVLYSIRNGKILAHNVVKRELFV